MEDEAVPARTEFYFFYASDSLVLDDDTIYVQTKPGLKAVSTDGTVQWTFENLFESQQTPDVVSPIVTDDVVVAGTYGTPYEEIGQVETVFGIDPDGWKRTLANGVPETGRDVATCGGGRCGVRVVRQFE